MPPSELTRSLMPAVGSPPDQNIASMAPSFMPCTVSGSDSFCRLIPASGSTPAAVSSRSAITSVPELAEPVDTVLPFMPSIEVMPASVRTSTCV